MNKASKQKSVGITAWLVTWEHVGDHAKPPCKIAAILNRKTPAAKVRDMIEVIYANSKYSPYERIEYARDRRNSPYPAEFERIDGVPWQGWITCGHNPHLHGRIVDNLSAPAESMNESRVTWDERQPPTLTRKAE